MTTRKRHTFEQVVGKLAQRPAPREARTSPTSHAEAHPQWGPAALTHDAGAEGQVARSGAVLPVSRQANTTPTTRERGCRLGWPQPPRPAHVPRDATAVARRGALSHGRIRVRNQPGAVAERSQPGRGRGRDRPVSTAGEARRLPESGRENRELRRADDILRRLFAAAELNCTLNWAPQWWSPTAAPSLGNLHLGTVAPHLPLRTVILQRAVHEIPIAHHDHRLGPLPLTRFRE